MSSALDLIIDALQDIGAVSFDRSLVRAEDIDKGLRKFNARGLNWNTREGFKKFERMQTFPVIASKQSYIIGAANDVPTPDFIVAAGKRPQRIDHGNWVLSAGAAPHLSYPVDFIEVEEYEDILLADLSNVWPYRIYYQKTGGSSGTLWPWPFPTDLTDSLQLFWWDQFTAVLIADINADLGWPDGYELAFGLTLAEDLCLPYGKTRAPELIKDAAAARTDIQSLNTKPPRCDTSDGSDGRWGRRSGWLGFRR